jgi:glyoxylase-like metal-dependent hydrolase (beta-lactamase superfamily II)
MPKQLDFGIYQLDLIPGHQPQRTSGYLIHDRKTILIETGAAPANPVIRSALKTLKIAVDAVFVTHIHLDHAGGAGLIMQQYPDATLLVHPQGKPHLVDPNKLLSGAREVYGTRFSSLFDPILPIEESRIRTVGNGERFYLSDDRYLEFFDAPGHARHHLIGLDSLSRGLFSGDAAGVYYDRLAADFGIDFCLPNTAPTQFDPEAMDRTMALMVGLRPKWIYFTHFGRAKNTDRLLADARRWIGFFRDDCAQYFTKTRAIDQLTDFIQDAVLAHLKRRGLHEALFDQSVLRFENDLNAKGIAAYVYRLERSRMRK